MSASEVISLDLNGGINFGNHTAKIKQKSNDFEVNGDIYNVKTHSEITRVEKNGKLLFESVPGASVSGFVLTQKDCEFSIVGYASTQITMELEPGTEYDIYIDGANVGRSKSNLSSKLSFSAELNENYKKICIKRI